MMDFQNRRSQSWGEIFHSNFFCWTNGDVKLFKTRFLDRRRIFIGPAEGLCSPDFFSYLSGGWKIQLSNLILNPGLEKPQ